MLLIVYENISIILLDKHDDYKYHISMARRIQTYIILGFYLAVGIVLGLALSKLPPPRSNSITVDIVKENDQILLYEHYSDELIFEYDRNKKADKKAYEEFEEVWIETVSLN